MRKVVSAVCCVAAAGVIFASHFANAREEKKTPELPTGTHEVVKSINVKSNAKGLKLQTLCSGKDGNLYVLLGSDRYGDKADSGEVQVFDGAGQKVRDWKVNFQCQAINCSPDGTVFVAGDGKLAVYDTQGQAKTEMELPFVKTLLADPEKLRKKAEEQRDSEIKSCEEQIKEYKNQAEEIKKKEESKRSKEEMREMLQAEANAKTLQPMLERAKKKNLDDYVSQLTSRLRIVNAIAATEKDIFVTCGEPKGYGYAVWRMDRNFENPKQVMSGLRGCCGQMDVQCCDDCLVVARNCDHCVGKYDRDGKEISKFGKRASRDGSPDGFGSCCNPMNVRPGSDGRVYTAESEGIVRVFDKDGKPEGIVGSVKLTGGCKNVALAVSPDGNTVWFCDHPGSKVHVMVRKPESAKSVSE